MKRRYDDDDERPHWAGRLAKGIIAGVIVCGAAVAAISIFVLPPPAPPPPAETAEAESGPRVVDGIEVAERPAYFGVSEQDEAEPGGDAPAETAIAAPDPAGPIELSGPALVVNAEPFEAAPDEPLVAVVIDDAGASPMLHDQLFALGMPLTIGVVSGGAGDKVTARTARDAGYEVVAQLPMAAPGEAAGAALEYELPAAEAAERTQLLMRRVPVAVAAARPLAAPMPPDRDMLAGIMDALGPLGFAWLGHGVSRGPATLPESGPEAIFAVSQITIPPGTTGADAHGMLDRAAVAATEAGGVVVMAAAEEPILLALQLWAGAAKATLAPLSAVIRRQNGGDAVPEPEAEAAEAAGPPETAEASQPAN